MIIASSVNLDFCSTRQSK